MLLLFSYVSYLISPSSSNWVTANYPLLTFFFYPIFLFYILKHILDYVGQIKINSPYPSQKYTIFTCLLQENLDVEKLKTAISKRILQDERFKDLKNTIKNNFFISYACPAQKFNIGNHVQVIDGPFERDATLYQFLELNMMGLFESDEKDPKWTIFLVKKFEKNPVLVFKFLSEYGFTSRILLDLLADRSFPVKTSIMAKEDFEWSLSKNLRLMKRLIDVETKSDEIPTKSIFEFIKRMLTPQKQEITRKKVVFTESTLNQLLESKDLLQEDQGFLSEREVDFIFNVFKLVGLFIPHALMSKAFSILEKKYQTMGYVNTFKFQKEIPGIIKRMYLINWKEQMFSIGITSQVYGSSNAVVLIQNENFKRK